MNTTKIFIKLVQEAIVPALIVIAAKLVGIIIVMLLLGIQWNIISSYPIPYVSFYSYADYMVVSSWSNFFVFMMLVISLTWVLIKAHIFHATHITPRLRLRLLNIGLMEMQTDTIEISHQALVWLSYIWLFIVFLAVQAYFGYFYWWMFGVSVVLGTVFTWLFVLDLEREITFV